MLKFLDAQKSHQMQFSEKVLQFLVWNRVDLVKSS